MYLDIQYREEIGEIDVLLPDSVKGILSWHHSVVIPKKKESFIFNREGTKKKKSREKNAKLPRRLSPVVVVGLYDEPIFRTIESPQVCGVGGVASYDCTLSRLHSYISFKLLLFFAKPCYLLLKLTCENVVYESDQLGVA